MSVFIDTSALVAGLVEADFNHASAARMWHELRVRREPLLTTSYVVLEAHALAQNRYGLETVRGLVNGLLPLARIEWVGPRIHQMAVDTLLAANRRNLSLVDCVSFLVMREQRIDRVFTFDRHFAEQGFTVLPQ